jgi:hypothetical protein
VLVAVSERGRLTPVAMALNEFPNLGSTTGGVVGVGDRPGRGGSREGLAEIMALSALNDRRHRSTSGIVRAVSNQAGRHHYSAVATVPRVQCRSEPLAETKKGGPKNAPHHRAGSAATRTAGAGDDPKALYLASTVTSRMRL